MVWQDELNQLWLADLNPTTGEISPFDGKGLLVDTGLSNILTIGNGPEFGYGNGETILCYNKTIDLTRTLATASKDELGNWVPALEDLGENRYRPICSPEGTPDPARMVYVQEIGPGDKVVSWRVAGDSATERSFPTLAGVGGRWTGTERAFISPAAVEGVQQLFWSDIDLETTEQITFDSDTKFNAFAWHAPEFDEVLISAAINVRAVGIYRRIAGDWTRIYTFEVPGAFDFVSSPEPFVHNGKSYITLISASALTGVPPLPYLPKGPSEVWIANIDPSEPFFRRVDNGTGGLTRLEPEPFMLTTGPAIYFTEQDPISGNAVTRVADTGLGSPTAGDSDGDGVSDDADNCSAKSNPGQIDADGDGIGNRCDADVDNDCVVTTIDLNIIRATFGSAYKPSDINTDGIINWIDLWQAWQMLGSIPGPSPSPQVCDAEQ
jgi:hypothetical protein